MNYARIKKYDIAKWENSERPSFKLNNFDEFLDLFIFDISFFWNSSTLVKLWYDEDEDEDINIGIGVSFISNWLL